MPLNEFDLCNDKGRQIRQLSQVILDSLEHQIKMSSYGPSYSNVAVVNVIMNSFSFRTGHSYWEEKLKLHHIFELLIKQYFIQNKKKSI